MPVNQKALLLGVVVLGGGFAAYQFWYLPDKQKKELLRKQILAQYGGGQRDDGSGAIGTIACLGLAASQGVPPQAVGSLCQQIGPMAGQALEALPGLIEKYGPAVQTILEYSPPALLYKGAKAVAGDVYGGIKTVAGDVEHVGAKVVNVVTAPARTAIHAVTSVAKKLWPF